VGLAPAPESTEDGPAKSLTSAMGQAVGAVVRQHVIEMLQPERADKVSREAQKIVNESNAQPCACEKYRSSWTRTSRSEPRCIFIDLGAANGDTFRNFLDDGYGPVRDCGHGSGRWEAYLVEANPYFQPQLKIIAQNDQHRVHQFGGRAAYVCEGHASFYVAWDPNHNHWGSSMDPQLHHGEDWQHMCSLGFIEFNKTIKVTVPTININKLIYENTIPDDYVIVKMDIEGAEFDVLPCLAQSPAANHLDHLFMERHPAMWQLGQTSVVQLDDAIQLLKSKGVRVPEYFSQTL